MKDGVRFRANTFCFLTVVTSVVVARGECARDLKKCVVCKKKL